MSDGDDAPGGDAHGAQHALVDVQLANDLGLDALHDVAVGVQDAAHQLRLVERPAVGEGSVGVQNLDGTAHVVALADARLVDLAGVVLLVEGAPLPVIRGHDPGNLAGKIDTGGLAEAPLVRPVGQAIDTEHAGQAEEECVAGVGEATVDVDQAEALLVPVPVLPLADLDEGLGLDIGGGGDLAVLEGARSGHQLVGRARWVLLADGVVEHGACRVAQQLLVLRVGDAEREGVVVVSRQRDHGQDLAVLGIHGHDHAVVDAHDVHGPLEGLLGVLLDSRVDGQLQRVARLGRSQYHRRAHLVALPIELDLLQPEPAAQHLLVGRLQTSLADEVLGPVVAIAESLILGSGDAAGPAQHMGHELAVGVAASCLEVHLHAREHVLVFADDARRLGLDVGDADWLELGADMRVQTLDDLASRDVRQSREALGHLGPQLEWHLGGHDTQDEGRHVLDQQASLAVIHEATRDGDRPRDGRLLSRETLELRGLRQLQLEEPQAQPGDRQDDGDPEDGQAGCQTPPVRPLLDGAADGGRRAHAVTTPAARVRRSAGRGHVRPRPR